MSGFGSFIKKIEGKVDVDTIRETQRTGLWERDFDPVHTQTSRYSVLGLQDLVTEVTELAREPGGGDPVGLHNLITRRLQALEEDGQQLGVNTPSEQQGRVRSDDGHSGAWTDDSDRDADGSPSSSTTPQLPW